MNFGQVVAQCDLGLPLECVLQRLRAHIRVAVAVSADPLSHAQKAVDAALAQLAFQVGIQLGDFAQEGGFVITQRVFNLVGHGQFGEAQQPGLPQLHHTGANLRLVGSQFPGSQCVFARGRAQRQQFDGIACHQQLRDAALGVQDTFALHFGRVRRQNRRYKTAGQRLHDGCGRNTCPAQARQRHVYAALLRVAGPFMDGAPPDMVPVLGQIGQVAEIGEGADHADRLVAAKSGQQLLEGAVGFVVGVTAKGHRKFADLLDQVESRLAVLVPDHVAQNAAQQADVFDQRAFVFTRAFGGFGGWGFGHGVRVRLLAEVRVCPC